MMPLLHAVSRCTSPLRVSDAVLPGRMPTALGQLYSSTAPSAASFSNEAACASLLTW
jgi:hypothetical protein